jgi:DNA-directed RNA polymerase specialized sigma24 family protein
MDKETLDLAERARCVAAGDDFRRCCVRLAEPLRPFISSEDLQQAAITRFLDCTPSSSKFGNDQQLFRYLHAIAANIAIDCWRRASRHKTWVEKLHSSDQIDTTMTMIEDESRQFMFRRVITESVGLLKGRSYFMSACFLLRNLYNMEYEGIAACFAAALKGPLDINSVAKSVNESARYANVNELSEDARILVQLLPTQAEINDLASHYAVKANAYWADGQFPFGRLRSWSHQTTKAIRVHVMARGLLLE